MTEQTAETPPVGMVGPDEDAPYGRRPDGSPRRRPGRKPGQTASTTTRKRPTSTPQSKSYREPLIGLMQIPAGGLALAGMQRPVFAADAAAITIHAPNIAEALDQLAQERPEIAAVLDRVLQVGPYGVLIAAVSPLVLQILTNHRAIPAGVMGTQPPEILLSNFMPNLRMPEPSDPTENGQQNAATVTE